MRKFFYARISTKEQIVELKSLGIEEEYMFLEVASGKDLKKPEYQLLKPLLRELYILYIKFLERLGKNKQINEINL